MSYKASKSKSQGRKSWSISFRHPMRVDAAGKPGLKIRRGLGTDNEQLAEELVVQMNQLLSDQQWWNIGALEKAHVKFDERIVSAFYDELAPSLFNDPWEIREKFMPLPTKEEGYAKIQLLGTTGAGKTTLLRQLIGSHPEYDRFPSTSISKTTVCDMEIILSQEPQYEAVVTFFPSEKIRLYIEECVMNAGKSHAYGERQQEVVRHLLEHTDQRFRLSYLLGSYTAISSSRINEIDNDVLDSDMDEIEDIDYVDPDIVNGIELSSENRKNMKYILEGFIQKIQTESLDAWIELKELLRDEKGSLTAEDEETMEILFEEHWREKDSFYEIVDAIFEEVESKFDYLKYGSWQYNYHDWPQILHGYLQAKAFYL